MTASTGREVMDTLKSLVGPMVLPAALVGFSSNVIQQWFPVASIWVGRTSFVLLMVTTVVGLVLYVTRRIVPRRFANEIFVVDVKMNLAMIEHPHFKRIQPPGSRLGYHEPPHEAIDRVVRSELGLYPEQITLWPPVPERKEYGHVKIVPTPFQVQVERQPQRLGVREHYDFIYVGKVAYEKPTLTSALNPRWMSVEELERIAEEDIKRAPFSDVIPTFRRILRAMEHDGRFVSGSQPDIKDGSD
jgi:hypothetical protein